jgi:hypothetical protein
MNCELVVFVIFCQLCCIVKFDMFTDRILDFDCYRCIFAPNFRFRCFRNTDIVSVSIVTVFDFVSDKKYENGISFSVYRPFSAIFIPRDSARIPSGHLRTLTGDEGLVTTGEATPRTATP